MLYSHIIFLCVSLADPSKAELLQVYKYKPETVELAAWTGNVSTFRSFSRTACGGRATRDGWFSFAFDASEKTCKVGALDLEATTPNGDDGESVMLQGEESTRSEIIRCLFKEITSDFGQGALILGNQEGDREVRVILPNGGICGRAEHGVPDFQYNGVQMTMLSGVVEADGVIYKCLGTLLPASDPPTYTGAYYKSNNRHSLIL